VGKKTTVLSINKDGGGGRKKFPRGGGESGKKKGQPDCDWIYGRVGGGGIDITRCQSYGLYGSLMEKKGGGRRAKERPVTYHRKLQSQKKKENQSAGPNQARP